MPDTGETPLPRGTFSALGHRNYRLFWIGNLISYVGDWLDQVALNWLVISTTGSPVMLGLVNLGRGLPMIVFGLIGGVVADRVDRRRLMMVTQTLAMLIAILLAVVVYMVPEPVWIVLLLATCRGVTIAFNLPARHSLIYELVPRDDLASAVAINSISMNMAKIAGPLASAAIIAVFGASRSCCCWCWWRWCRCSSASRTCSFSPSLPHRSSTSAPRGWAR
jgi:MFS transporter, DHA1 family, staphyloferrin A biosynthesis exporter